MSLIALPRPSLSFASATRRVWLRVAGDLTHGKSRAFKSAGWRVLSSPSCIMTTTTTHSDSNEINATTTTTTTNQVSVRSPGSDNPLEETDRHLPIDAITVDTTFFLPILPTQKGKENPRQSRSVGCMTGLWCLRSHLSRPHRRRRCRLFCLNIPPSVSHFLFSRLFPLFCMYIRQEKKKKGRRRRGIEFIRQVVRVPFSIDVNAADCLCAAQRQEEEEEELPFLFSSAF